MKRIAVFALLMSFMLGICPAPADAGSEVGIVINGQVRNFNPGGQLVQGRTMLPVRYIVEDPAMGGTASWDAVAKKVTITCRERNYLFVIGQRTAMVDGVPKELDVAPYIYNGRTYIPLRFFSEEAGAVVGWKARTSTVVLNFASRPIVMGYYYCGSPDLLDHSSLTDVAFRWLQTDGQGSLFYEYWNNADGEARRVQALNRARELGIKTHASVMLMGWDAAGRQSLHQLLSDPANRQRLVQNLREHASGYGYNGVNVDLEGVPVEDRDNFSLFIEELASVLHSDGRTLSVAVPARTSYNNWHRGFDYARIGKAADLVVVMAYDFSTSQPGASAPINWVEDVIHYAQSLIPAQKLLLGIGTYGYDWNLNTIKKKTFTQDSLDRFMNGTQSGTFSLDPVTFTPVITYREAGQDHRVWFENLQSLGEKYACAIEHTWAGVSFWQMKGAFSDFYRVMGETI